MAPAHGWTVADADGKPQVLAGNRAKTSILSPGLVTVLGQGQVAPGSTEAALIQL